MMDQAKTVKHFERKHRLLSFAVQKSAPGALQEVPSFNKINRNKVS
jgi:hypothetical protein